MSDHKSLFDAPAPHCMFCGEALEAEDFGLDGRYCVSHECSSDDNGDDDEEGFRFVFYTKFVDTKEEALALIPSKYTKEGEK